MCLGGATRGAEGTIYSELVLPYLRGWLRGLEGHTGGWT